MRKTISLIGVVIIIVGAILIPLSQIRVTTMDYVWQQGNVEFYAGQPMVFNMTFELPSSYRFEVHEVNWTGSCVLDVQSPSNLSIMGSILESPPWVWTVDPAGYWNSNGTKTVFFDAGTYGDLSHPALAQKGTYVSIYKSVEKLGAPYDYLFYVGTSVAFIGAAIAELGIILSGAKDKMSRPTSNAHTSQMLAPNSCATAVASKISILTRALKVKRPTQKREKACCFS